MLLILLGACLIRLSVAGIFNDPLLLGSSGCLVVLVNHFGWHKGIFAPVDEQHWAVIMMQLRNRIRLPKEVARSNTGNSAHKVN